MKPTLRMPEMLCAGTTRCTCSTQAHTARSTAYFQAIQSALTARPELVELLPTACPECGESAADTSHPYEVWLDWHVSLKGAGEPLVLVGCEGYWVLDPHLVGVESPEWQDWRL